MGELLKNTHSIIIFFAFICALLCLFFLLRIFRVPIPPLSRCVSVWMCACIFCVTSHWVIYYTTFTATVPPGCATSTRWLLSATSGARWPTVSCRWSCGLSPLLPSIAQPPPSHLFCLLLLQHTPEFYLGIGVQRCAMQGGCYPRFSHDFFCILWRKIAQSNIIICKRTFSACCFFVCFFCGYILQLFIICLFMLLVSFDSLQFFFQFLCSCPYAFCTSGGWWAIPGKQRSPTTSPQSVQPPAPVAQVSGHPPVQVLWGRDRE